MATQEKLSAERETVIRTRSAASNGAQTILEKIRTIFRFKK
jgi:hypothetical protein